MKKFFFAVALFAGASTAFVACSGSDDEPKPSLDDIKEIELTVDKNAIEANGEDVVNFTVTSDTGVNLNDKAVILIPGEEITFLDEMYYTSTVNETVTFQARYNGIYSNEVTVEVKNRSKYEKYFRRVLISQLTGTWCVNCPGMTRSLKLVSEQFPDRIEILAMHGSSSQGTDPYAIPQTEEMFSQFPDLRGYPSAVIDMRQKSVDATTSSLVRAINKSLLEYPATCGVKIASTYNKETKKVDAKITVAAEATNKYALGLAVVVDGLEYTQTGAESDPDYLHNNVVIAINNLRGEFVGDGVINAGEEVSHTFTIDMSTTKYNIEDMRVVAFILAQSGDAYYVNNSASCKLDGGSIDYTYNE